MFIHLIHGEESTRVDGLHPYSTYEVYVFAINYFGPGPETYVEVVTHDQGKNRPSCKKHVQMTQKTMIMW